VDCSLSYCSFGLAWGDAPTAVNTAHGYAECSNRGTCDTKSGECKCFPGFEGKACRRATCPNDCSGHGQCLLTTDADISAFSYTLWDMRKIQICKCDPQYSGSDCSQRMCPKGDDPLTVVTAAGATRTSVQTVTISDGNSYCAAAVTTTAGGIALAGTPACGNTYLMVGAFTLTYQDQYGGSWTTRPIAGVEPMASSTGQYSGALVADLATSLSVTNGGALVYASNEEVAAILQNELLALPNKVISDVSVTSSVGPLVATGETFRQYSITFNAAGNSDSGTQNLLSCSIAGCTTAGCQPYFAGLASGGAAGTKFCRTAIVKAADALVEAAECSNRGLCDRETGVCACAQGYSRHDCSVQTVLV